MAISLLQIEDADKNNEHCILADYCETRKCFALKILQSMGENWRSLHWLLSFKKYDVLIKSFRAETLLKWKICATANKLVLYEIIAN